MPIPASGKSDVKSSSKRSTEAIDAVSLQIEQIPKDCSSLSHVLVD